MLSVFVTIWLLHVAALITPGANMLLVSQLSASGQPRAAMRAALGVAAGAVIWSTAAVLGVNALFVAFPTVRLVLQVGGALYLLYIASRLWRAQAPSASEPRVVPAWRAFRLGLLTNLSNPKSALFFGSVFSAALPAHPSAAVLAASVALVVGNALAWHLGLAYVFSRPRVRAGYAAQRGIVGRLAGAALGALGVSLLFASLREARR
ncbi:LysE family translocator [Ideonella sp.]|uniref:LysE family translocator n=1 Tax=Ideonella sp. TaxID=1929293 RepID=UPI0035B1F7F9